MVQWPNCFVHESSDNLILAWFEEHIHVTLSVHGLKTNIVLPYRNMEKKTVLMCLDQWMKQWPNYISLTFSLDQTREAWQNTITKIKTCYKGYKLMLHIRCMFRETKVILYLPSLMTKHTPSNRWKLKGQRSSCSPPTIFL